MGKNEKNSIFSNFTQIVSGGHSCCSKWLKFGPNTPYMIRNKVTEAFLKILIFSDFMLIFAPNEIVYNQKKPKFSKKPQ